MQELVHIDVCFTFFFRLKLNGTNSFTLQPEVMSEDEAPFLAIGYYNYYFVLCVGVNTDVGCLWCKSQMVFL